MQAKTTTNKKRLSGVVVSNKMKDTIVVDVERYIQHPKYKKYYTVNKKYKAHDAGNTAVIGDKVTIESCRPMSKTKSFTLVKN